MSERDQDRAESLEERRKEHDDQTKILRRRSFGEEIDPDSIRQVPDVDEDGDLIDLDDDEDDDPDH